MACLTSVVLLKENHIKVARKKNLILFRYFIAKRSGNCVSFACYHMLSHDTIKNKTQRSKKACERRKHGNRRMTSAKTQRDESDLYTFWEMRGFFAFLWPVLWHYITKAFSIISFRLPPQFPEHSNCFFPPAFAISCFGTGTTTTRTDLISSLCNHRKCEEKRKSW